MKTIIFSLSLIVILGLLWAVIVEPNILHVKKYVIKNSALKGLKIVYASDFHIKKYERYRLKKTVRTINKQNPDIILLGGDFVNGHNPGKTLVIEEISKELSELKSKQGTYAVLGNHDCWQGASHIRKELEKNNITVLENENIKAGNVTIAGVEDMQTKNPDIDKTLKNVKGPVILLSHTPDIFPYVPVNVNLTLAGHLHGGQINVPFIGPLIVPSQFGLKYAYGEINEDNKKMIVSKGLGTSILAMRFNCIPEIVVVEFE